MTTTTQPLTGILPSATYRPHSSGHLTRLLRLWADATHQAVSASAHGSADARALVLRQEHIEQVLADHLPESSPDLDELIVWEATLLHISDVPPRSCLICRTAQLGLPAEVYSLAKTGGLR